MRVNIAEIHVFIEFCYFSAIFQSLLLFEGLEFVKIFQGLCLFGGLRLLLWGTFPGSMLIWGSTLIRKSRVICVKNPPRVACQFSRFLSVIL